MPDGATIFPDSRLDKPVTVRIAGPADEAALHDIFLGAHADNGLASMSPARVREWVHVFTHHPPGAVHGAAGVIDAPDGRIAACCALVMGQPWYSEDWILEDRMIFVRPEYRRSSYGRDLINFGKWYAEKLGIPLVVGILSLKDAERKAKLYGRYMRNIGASFVHNPASLTVAARG